MPRLIFSYESTEVSFNFSTTRNNSDAEALGMLMNLLAASLKGPHGSRISPAPSAPTQTYSVKLASWGPQKIGVIKVVREITNLGLKEAKDMVEFLGDIKSGVSKDEANKIAELIDEAGGSVEIRPAN